MLVTAHVLNKRLDFVVAVLEFGAHMIFGWGEVLLAVQNCSSLTPQISGQTRGDDQHVR